MCQERLRGFNVLKPGWRLRRSRICHEEDDRDGHSLEEEISARTKSVSSRHPYMTMAREGKKKKEMEVAYSIYHAPSRVQIWVSMNSEIEAMVALAFCRHTSRHSLSAGSSPSAGASDVHLSDAQRRRMGRQRTIRRFQSRHIRRLRTSASQSGSAGEPFFRYMGSSLYQSSMGFCSCNVSSADKVGLEMRR